MPALFIIAHAPLASAFESAAGHVFAEFEDNLACYDVRPDASDTDSQAEAAVALAGLGDKPVLILTDVFGGTPCNLALRLAQAIEARVAVGINLAMLWRAITYREKPLDELLELALAGARMGVMQASVSRPQNQANKPLSHDSNQSDDQQ